MDTGTLGYLCAACLLLILRVCHSLDCTPDQYELNGFRCCSKCALGQGVLSACSPDDDTECEPCRHGESYSAVSNHEQQCQPCKICPQYSYVQRNCNSTHDTECECDTDYFWNKDIGSCRKCEFCPLGYGSRKKCSGEKNTVCVRCQPGSYSDEISGDRCKLCTRCKSNQLMAQSCDVTHDTVCEELVEEAVPPPVIVTQPKYDVIPRTTLRPVTPAPDQSSDTKNIVIPACIGALLLVIIISIICTVMKCVRNRKEASKQNAQKGNISYSAVGDPVTTLQHGSVVKPAGSDSGVSIEQETKATTRVSELSVIKLQMISAMLQHYTGQWTAFAQQLGYNSANIASFETRASQLNCPPADIVLSEWSKNATSTVAALTQVLYKLERADIVQIIHGDSRALAMNFPPNYYTLQNMQNMLQPNGSHNMFHTNSPQTMSQHSMSAVGRVQGYPTPAGYHNTPPGYIQPAVQHVPNYMQQIPEVQANYSPASSQQQGSYSQTNLIQAQPAMAGSRVGSDQMEQRASPVYIPSGATSSSSGGECGVVYTPNQSRGSYQQMHTQQMHGEEVI